MEEVRKQFRFPLRRCLEKDPRNRLRYRRRHAAGHGSSIGFSPGRGSVTPHDPRSCRGGDDLLRCPRTASTSLFQPSRRGTLPGVGIQDVDAPEARVLSYTFTVLLNWTRLYRGNYVVAGRLGKTKGKAGAVGRRLCPHFATVIQHRLPRRGQAEPNAIRLARRGKRLK